MGLDEFEHDVRVHGLVQSVDVVSVPGYHGLSALGAGRQPEHP